MKSILRSLQGQFKLKGDNMEVLIFFLMHSIRSMPFPLSIHLLQGLAIHPDHLSDPNLNNQGPHNHLKSMMALSIFHLKSTIVESGCNESFEGL